MDDANDTPAVDEQSDELSFTRTDVWTRGHQKTANAVEETPSDVTESTDVPTHVADGPESTSLNGSSLNGRNGAGVTSTFLRELAHAMQAAAEQERARIADIAAEDGAAHSEMARVRGLAESDELRRSADSDIAGIEVWQRAEIEKLRREAGQRTAERRAQLDRYLERHNAIIDAEVGSVEGAVNDFRATLDRFFSELLESTDPSDIAGRAGQLPPAPDLAAVRAAARAAAVAEVSDDDTPDREASGDETLAGGVDGDSNDGPPDATSSPDQGPQGGDDAEAGSDEPRAAARLVRWIVAHTGIL